MYAAGIAHGIIQAGFSARPLERVQVASIQTLWARAVCRQSMDLPPARLLVVDKAHHCPAETYAKIIKAYPEAILLGLTATPCRGDGRGLGGIFDVILECPQVADLIAQGYLVRTRVYAPVDPDLKGVRTVAGDYVESQLAERMDTDRLVGGIIEHWHKFGEGHLVQGPPRGDAQFYGEWPLAAAKAEGFWKEAYADEDFRRQVKHVCELLRP